jgi:hypothetical protein
MSYPDEGGRIASLEKFDPELARELRETMAVLQSPEGEVLDGFHRLDANPNWKRTTVTTADTPLRKTLVKVVLNNNRRYVSRDERGASFRELFLRLKERKKEDGSEYSNPEIFTQINGVTGFTLGYIRMLLPEFTGPQKPKTHPPRILPKSQVEDVNQGKGDKTPMPEGFKLILESSGRINSSMATSHREGMSPEEFVKLAYERHESPPDRYLLSGLERMGVNGDEASELIDRFRPLPKVPDFTQCPICCSPVPNKIWISQYKIAKDIDPERAALMERLLTTGEFPITFNLEEDKKCD